MNEGPDILVIWDRMRKARQPYRCVRCGDQIEAGQRYQSIGYREDGLFRHDRMHEGAQSIYAISGCPRLAERELAELEVQFERDQLRYFPNSEPCHADPLGEMANKGRA